jgi:hypothetical protein
MFLISVSNAHHSQLASARFDDQLARFVSNAYAQQCVQFLSRHLNDSVFSTINVPSKPNFWITYYIQSFSAWFTTFMFSVGA